MPRWTVGSNQHKKTAAIGVSGRAAEPNNALTGPDDSIHPSLVETRINLLSTLSLLGEHRDAITLIGSHAVHERTKTLAGVDSTTTKDGDLAITPELVSDNPSIESLMRSAGFELKASSRPGQWFRGLDKDGNQTNSIDLLSPNAMAGRGRRSVGNLADVHGTIAVGRAEGIELATYDRDLLRLESLDGSGEYIEAWVAGTAALVCAKSYKLHERIADARNKSSEGRVQPKDASDLWRLIATSDGSEVRATFEEYASHPVIGDSVTKGMAMIRDLIESGEVVHLAELNLGQQVAPGRTATDFDRWITEFEQG